MTARTPVHRLHVATELHRFIDELQLGLIRVNDTIVTAYF